MIGCTSMCSAQARVYFGNMIMTSCPSLRNSDLKFASNDRCRFGMPNFIPYEWWNVLGITYMKKWDEISAVTAKAKKNLLEPKQDSVFIWGRTGSFLKLLRSKKVLGVEGRQGVGEKERKCSMWKVTAEDGYRPPLTRSIEITTGYFCLCTVDLILSYVGDFVLCYCTVLKLM